MENKLEVIIMMGIPGSGKSSFAWNFPEHSHINQDRLGNRNDCINALKRSLSQGRSAVIDRTNISRSQRKYFIDVAKDFGAKIYCIFLDVPAEICIERVKNRKGHETIPETTPEPKIIEIVSKFNNTLELPQYSEGIDEILHITGVDDNFVYFTEHFKRSEPDEAS